MFASSVNLKLYFKAKRTIRWPLTVYPLNRQFLVIIIYFNHLKANSFLIVPSIHCQDFWFDLIRFYLLFPKVCHSCYSFTFPFIQRFLLLLFQIFHPFYTIPVFSCLTSFHELFVLKLKFHFLNRLFSMMRTIIDWSFFYLLFVLVLWFFCFRS